MIDTNLTSIASNEVQTPPTSFGCLDGGINQSLSASHGVEVELCRSQAGQVRVLYEPPRLRPVIVLDEVRQRAVSEPKRDAFSLDVLLSHARNDLDTVTSWQSHCRIL